MKMKMNMNMDINTAEEERRQVLSTAIIIFL
jgi:hypothetical protein